MQIIIKKKLLFSISWFLLGMLCFFISQPLLRFPLLKWIQGTTKFIIWSISYPILLMIAIALSAGIFEEGFRFIFKQFLVRPKESAFLQPILFGLGHGFMEVLVLFIPNINQIIIMGTLSIAIIERVIAIIAHIFFTIIVWNGFQRNKKAQYLILGILAHGLLDLVALIAPYLGLSIWMVEGIFALFDVVGIAYIIHSKKYYLEGSL